MQKYNIWGEQIPYNKPGKAKADCMDLKKRFPLATILGWVRDVFGTKVTKDASYLDTFTYMDEIRKGKMSAYKGMDLYAKQLKECGVPHKTVVLEGAGHGFTLSKKYITWAEQYVAWIKGGAK